MGIERDPLYGMRVWQCQQKGCERVIAQGTYYCRDHLSPSMRQSEEVSPKMQARNRMVMMGECYVYAVDGGDAVKFGKAIDAEARFSSLQTGSPIDLRLLGYVQGPKTLEKDVHIWAKPFNRRGEWFNKTEPVMRLVAAIQSGTLDAVLAVLKKSVDYESK